MRTRRVKNLAPMLDPVDPGWASVPVEQVSMMSTPLAMQPTAYIRNSWEGREYGRITALEIASVHDGKQWALRASWRGVSPAGKDFPDSLAIALPVRGKPVLALMGAVDAPIHFLRWQANKAGAVSQIATGIGSSAPGPVLACSAQARAEGDRWQVVISRLLGGGTDVAPLVAGHKTGIGFAVWAGGNDERGGIKAFSIDWAELALDA
ncbi:Selenate reductase subunit gamma precursor [Azoarcus sp. Aa7]|nr:Selenate reductase subunit gamma precursor [Azoarcus sp. Aa7]